MLGLLTEIRNHPKGLLTLFLTELWERFSYYGMRAILVLYLVSEHNSSNPGLGWSNSEAIKLYGWYTALVYLACIPGGIIGDKYLNNRDAVSIGGAFLCIGHLTLAIQNPSCFFREIPTFDFTVFQLKAMCFATIDINPVKCLFLRNP